jgi:hypothetical protein
MLQVQEARAHCPKLPIETGSLGNELRQHEGLLDQYIKCRRRNEETSQGGFFKREQVNSLLVSQNKYVALSVDMMSDSEDEENMDSSLGQLDKIKDRKDMTSIVYTASNNGRGPDKSQLGAPVNACLIPIILEVVEPVNSPQIASIRNTIMTIGPKKGERYFIRTMNLEREIYINVTITTLNTHTSLMIQVLLDSGATRL